MLISERVFELLKEKGMSQKEFSLRTGIAQSTISDWKSKKVNPASDKILIICDVLQVSPYELLAGSAAQYENPNCIVIDRESDLYILVEMISRLKSDQRLRLQGYLEALSGMR